MTNALPKIAQVESWEESTDMFTFSQCVSCRSFQREFSHLLEAGNVCLRHSPHCAWFCWKLNFFMFWPNTKSDPLHIWSELTQKVCEINQKYIECGILHNNMNIYKYMQIKFCFGFTKCVISLSKLPHVINTQFDNCRAGKKCILKEGDHSAENFPQNFVGQASVRGCIWAGILGCFGEVGCWMVIYSCNSAV